MARRKTRASCEHDIVNRDRYALGCAGCPITAEDVAREISIVRYQVITRAFERYKAAVGAYGAVSPERNGIVILFRITKEASRLRSVVGDANPFGYPGYSIIDEDVVRAVGITRNQIV